MGRTEAARSTDGGGRSRPGRRVGLFAASLIVSLALLEAGVRLTTRYPTHSGSNKVADAELGYRMDPTMGSIDANGFRNPVALLEADVVAIGDSHTYGVSASSADSWPQQLARLAGVRVYNFGVPGYGLLHYRTLFDRALALGPRQVFLGLYLTNDVADVYKLSGAERWRDWAAERGLTDFEVVGVESSLVDLLARTVAVFSFLHELGEASLGEGRIDRSEKGVDDDWIVVKEPESRKLIKRTRVASHVQKTDLDDPAIGAAFEASKELLRDMNGLAGGRGVELTVMLIPSMESVYYDLLIERDYPLPDTFHATVRNERRMTSELVAFLEAEEIGHVVLLPGLAAALREGVALYPSHDQGHPQKSGYAVYAAAAHRALLATGDG